MAGVCITIVKIHHNSRKTDALLTDIHQLKNPATVLFNKYWIAPAVYRRIPVFFRIHKFSLEDLDIVTDGLHTWSLTYLEKNTGQALATDVYSWFGGYSGKEQFVKKLFKTDFKLWLFYNQSRYDKLFGVRLSQSLAEISGTGDWVTLRSKFDPKSWEILHRLDVVRPGGSDWVIKDWQVNELVRLYNVQAFPYNLNKKLQEEYGETWKIRDAPQNIVVAEGIKQLDIQIDVCTKKKHTLFVYLGILLFCLVLVCKHTIRQSKNHVFGGYVLLITYVGLLVNIIFLPMFTFQAGIKKLVITYLFPWETNNIEFAFLNKTLAEVGKNLLENPTFINTAAAIIFTTTLLWSSLVAIGAQAYGMSDIRRVSHKVYNRMQLGKFKVADIGIIVLLGTLLGVDGAFEGFTSTDNNGSEFVSLETYNIFRYRSGVFLLLVTYLYGKSVHSTLKNTYFSSVYFEFRNIAREEALANGTLRKSSLVDTLKNFLTTRKSKNM
jgi:hypothetical protein